MGKPSRYVTSQLGRLSFLPSVGRWNEYQLSGWVIIINDDDGCRLLQHVQADSQPKLSDLVLGRRPLGAILHSSNEPGEFPQWLCHDDSTINIVLELLLLLLLLLEWYVWWCRSGGQCAYQLFWLSSYDYRRWPAVRSVTSLLAVVAQCHRLHPSLRRPRRYLQYRR